MGLHHHPVMKKTDYCMKQRLRQTVVEYFFIPGMLSPSFERHHPVINAKFEAPRLGSCHF